LCSNGAPPATLAISQASKPLIALSRSRHHHRRAAIVTLLPWAASKRPVRSCHWAAIVTLFSWDAYLFEYQVIPRCLIVALSCWTSTPACSRQPKCLFPSPLSLSKLTSRPSSST
jgi:hypothetical protein